MGKKIHIFSDCDLDGAVSLQTLYWLLRPKNASHQIVRVNDFKKDFENFTLANNIDDYEKIFILDLDVSQDCLDLVDRDNVVIIDHHDTHVQNKDKYKKASAIIELCSSCCRLIYNKFKHVRELSKHQQYLILLGDDYDSYELKLPESYDLNTVYWNYQGDRYGKFSKDFGRGFYGFNKFQDNIISLHAKKLHTIKSNLNIYKATLPIQNKDTKFVSTFADSCINEIAEYIINKYKSDVGIVVNLKTNKVSLRKSKQCEVHLGELCKKLADGGGHEYAAGGVLNESFMNFTKIFEPA
jgi:hypothetical protein